MQSGFSATPAPNSTSGIKIELAAANTYPRDKTSAGAKMIHLEERDFKISC
jgi:hypothetical protein